jgi:hypothetical protein
VRSAGEVVLVLPLFDIVTMHQVTR